MDGLCALRQRTWHQQERTIEARLFGIALLLMCGDYSSATSAGESARSLDFGRAGEMLSSVVGRSFWMERWRASQPILDAKWYLEYDTHRIHTCDLHLGPLQPELP
jgi:hypothetical protein